MQNEDYDIIIVGGGIVGLSLALALKPMRIAIIERAEPQIQTQFDYDARSIALSYASYKIFKTIGVWQQLQEHATPINTIHVSDQGGFGNAKFTAKEQKVGALGYIIEMQHLLATLLEQVKAQANITRICPASLTDLQTSSSGCEVKITDSTGETIYKPKLLIAADGGQSTVRKLLNIQTTQQDYGQHAIVANIGLTEEHNGVAYERFTPTGPLALLPMSEQRAALVWSLQPEQAKQILSLDEAEFLKQLQQAFGYRLGKFNRVGKRFSFPLALVQAKQQVGNGYILLGNSAHTIHPIAGQGFNLSLRDVAVLAELLTKQHQNNADLANQDLLRQYLQQRTPDQQRVIRLTDGLVKTFSHNIFPVKVLRNLGLTTLNMITPLKNLFAKHAMGVIAPYSKLVSGLELERLHE